MTTKRYRTTLPCPKCASDRVVCMSNKTGRAFVRPFVMDGGLYRLHRCDGCGYQFRTEQRVVSDDVAEARVKLARRIAERERLLRRLDLIDAELTVAR